MRAKRRIARSYYSVAAALVSVLAATMAGSSSLVMAGTAPPTRSPGAAISPDPSSVEAVDIAGSVGLVSQTIEFVIEPPSAILTDAEVPVGEIVQDDETVRARVNSSFVLRNSGRNDVSFNLGFPLNDLSGIKDANGNLPVVEGFDVDVGGVPTRYALTARTNPYGEGEPAIQWATFPVTLPGRTELAVGAGFTTTAAGQWPIAQFNYSLETATAWQGRIGDSEISVRLPYTASTENVFLGESTPGGVFDGVDVRWSRRNLEASAQNNFEVSILAPKVWQQILLAREAVALTPDSTDAWVALGRAYRAAIALNNGVPQGGTRQFVTLAEQSYEKAIELNPNVAEVHQEYAQLVYDLRIAEDLNTAQALPQLEKIVDHVQTALQLDPSNPATADLLLNVKQLVQDLAARQPSAQATALVEQVTAIEAMVVASAPASAPVSADASATPEAPATPELVPADSTAVVTDTSVLTDTQAGAVPTMSAEDEVAVAAAQSTMAASAVLTTTPSAPEVTAIAEAVATLGARETVVALAAVAPAEQTVIAETAITEPVVVTGEATADAVVAIGTAVSTTVAVEGTPGAAPQTLVARFGLMSIIGIACGVIVLLGILAAILVAVFGRRRKANLTPQNKDSGTGAPPPPASKP